MSVTRIGIVGGGLMGRELAAAIGRWPALSDHPVRPRLEAVCDSSGDADRICGLVRQAVELGADVIKADPTTDLADYRRVVTVARVPLLVRGGGRVTDREILERTHALLEQGAAGIVYGRNVIQHDNPAAMTRALMSVVHEGATPDEALARLA